MSTDKTGRPYIPLLAGLLLLFSACAPQHQAGNSPATFPPPTPPVVTGTAPPTTATAVTDPAPDQDAGTAHAVVETDTGDDTTTAETDPVDENTAAEPEQTVSLEVRELAGLGSWEEGRAAPEAEHKEVSYDFPVTINRQVEFYLNFFQTSQRTTFARWLARSGRYLPLIRQQLKAAGLPLDLAYLPMIESGYHLTAYSSAGAAGPWQFMSSTARHYGLKIDKYVDERRDPVKSTAAAITYLGRLYDEFGSWQLAVAAYNAGEGRIRRAIRHKKTTNFWELAQGRALKLETKRYVPKLIAAILIAKNPAKYGFDHVVPEKPLSYEIAQIPSLTPLKAVAMAGNLNLDELRNLNRQLRRAVTPPKVSSYPIKVPVGTKPLVTQNMPRVRALISTKFKTHTVRRSDTWTKICRKYNLNTATLLKANGIRQTRLHTGQQLRIPYQVTTYSLLAANAAAPDHTVGTDHLLLHTVRPGETLSHLAKRYHILPRTIAAWNGLKNPNSIRAGQQLALYLDKTTRRLAEQDSPPAAATAQTPQANQKRISVAAVKTDDQNPSGRLTYYRVRGGDTLWTIARRYNLTPEEIRRWNNLDGNLIHPGARLLLKIATDLDV